MNSKLNINIISEYIRNNDLSQTGFCKQCKISYTTFRKIVQSDYINPVPLCKIAKVMNIDVHQFFPNSQSNKQKIYHTKLYKNTCSYCYMCFCGRSGETRTRGLMVPNHARYQLRYTSIAKSLYYLIYHLSNAFYTFSNNINYWRYSPNFTKKPRTMFGVFQQSIHCLNPLIAGQCQYPN